MQHHHSVDASGVFSGPLGADLRAMLAPQENVLATLQVDLSVDLRFAKGWVVVTANRLMACDAGSTTWQTWAVGEGLSLKMQDHGGVGTLEEAIEVLSWKRLDLHAKPVIIVNINGFWDPLLALMDQNYIGWANYLAPVVAGSTLYVLDDSGTISAFK